jgi:putative NIF3 family GTP cyclohydrolase 1 type 2
LTDVEQPPRDAIAPDPASSTEAPAGTVTGADSDSGSDERADAGGDGHAQQPPAAGQAGAPSTISSSTYDLLRERLRGVAERLRDAAQALNGERAEVFASAPMALAEQDRLRTEQPSTPADAVSVGGLLVFGYNVGAALGKTRTVDDAFELFEMDKAAANDWTFTPLARQAPNWFLSAPGFQRDAGELFTYYSDTRLDSLTLHDSRLLMVFRFGPAPDDIRVLRWQLEGDHLRYIDAYGDHDVASSAAYDFHWTSCGREQLVEGRWQHLVIGDSLYVGFDKNEIQFRIDDVVEGGRTIFREPVAESGQVIGETAVGFALIDEIILIRLQPYREQLERFYLYNRLTRAVQRADAIGRNCHLLPEGQGVVFPGGYHLQNGETKVFSTDSTGFAFHAVHRSPNGEDILYVYRRASGEFLLCPYNVVTRTMDTPIGSHGYALFDDGVIVCLRGAPEPQRVHTINVYTSPFCTPDNYSPTVASDSFFGRTGNPELVRVLGEMISLSRDAADPLFNQAVFEALVARATTLLDGYGWLNQPEAHGVGSLLAELRKTAGSVLDEFASVVATKKEAAERLSDATRAVNDLAADAELPIRDAAAFIDKLAAARAALGVLSALSEVRQIDHHALDTLRLQAQGVYGTLATRAIEFLDTDHSLDSVNNAFDAAEHTGAVAKTAALVGEQIKAVDETGDRVVLLTDVVGGLEVDDPTRKTSVLGRLADCLARRNAVRAALDVRAASLRSAEADAGFAAAMAVLSQRATASISAAADAATCDAALASLSAELENAELRYGDVPAFADAIDTRRTELSTAFNQRRDALAAERTRQIDRLTQSAQRILTTIVVRASALPGRTEIDAFFAIDSLVTKVRSTAAELRTRGEAGRASELDVALGGARDQARRAANDRADLFEAGSVRIGTWKFGVNTEPFELRLDADLADSGHPHFDLRLTGTELQLPIRDDALAEFADLAGQNYPSETATIPRAAYLAFSALTQDIPTSKIAAYATSRIEDGFEPGVHDADAMLIVDALQPWWRVPALRVSGIDRAVAGVWVRSLDIGQRDELAKELVALEALGVGRSRRAFIKRVGPPLDAIAEEAGLKNRFDARVACDWLINRSHDAAIRPDAAKSAERLEAWARQHGLDLRRASFGQLVRWAEDLEPDAPLSVAAEAVWKVVDPIVPVAAGVPTTVTVTGLRSQHPTIVNGALTIDPSDALTTFMTYRRDGVARFRDFSDRRRALLAAEQKRLELDTLHPTVITSFVRNRLIDEVYLPLVGDNIARQLGLNGAAQGLLLLISPPGYGKTTLIEYVASLLGFALVKINGPALGDEVTSLDPAAAPNVAAAEELAKLNRAFAMANNVICYLDDVQHTSPALLQKFIPLCDATRRIEGVLEGQAKTFSLAGKRFVMVMAANPYTSSGASFRIPDMLANRADVHNLGDVAKSAAAAFAQSFVENGCGVNEVVAPVLSRSRQDLDVLLRAAGGEPLRSDDLSHPYGATELAQITKTLSHLLRVRDQLLKVNAAYIASATVDDHLRGEPAFLLQGSYRNMARIAQRIVPAMTPAEVDLAVAEHYRAESQTLAANAGWNLAKLGEVLGNASPQALAELATMRERWKASNVAGDPLAVMAAALRDIAAAVNTHGVGPASPVAVLPPPPQPLQHPSEQA